MSVSHRKSRRAALSLESLDRRDVPAMIGFGGFPSLAASSFAPAAAFGGLGSLTPGVGGSTFGTNATLNLGLSPYANSIFGASTGYGLGFGGVGSGMNTATAGWPFGNTSLAATTAVPGATLGVLPFAYAAMPNAGFGATPFATTGFGATPFGTAGFGATPFSGFGTTSFATVPFGNMSGTFSTSLGPYTDGGFGAVPTLGGVMF